MIDLHMHTTASDGRLTPAELVARVAAAGLTVIAVTDHDTVGAVDEVTALAASHGVRVVWSCSAVRPASTWWPSCPLA